MIGKHDRWKWIAACTALCLISTGLVHAQDEKVNGLIVARQGETLKVQTPDAANVVVLLTPDTQVQEPEGKLHMRKKEMGVTALVPGLNVKAQGAKNAEGQVVAEKVTFSAKDLKTANEIQAGLKPTEAEQQTQEKQIQAGEKQIQAGEQQIQANQKKIKDTNQRFSDLSDYDVKNTATVHFPVGSTTLSEQDKSALQQLAQNAMNQQGYLISVKGFADSSGNAVQNQKLSMERADAVTAYLEQSGKVPLIHIVAPGAMGTSNPEASNETKQGRAENRRVEVKVLVNRGLAEK